jgi:uncharacterized repeat protein (TIGR01451 family)
MRPFYVLAGVIALGLGVAGWTTLGQAQSDPKPLPSGGRPSRVEIPPSRPAPQPPPDDLFESLPAPPKRAPKKEVEPSRSPVRPIDPLELPDVTVPRTPSSSGISPISPSKPAIPQDPPKSDIKPTVFIPTVEAPDKPRTGGPAARQEPAISLEWHGPMDLQVGVPAEYTLVAKNTSAIPLHKVIVQVKFPSGSKVVVTEPKAEGNDLVLLWDHGTIASKQERSVKITIVPPAKGELLCQAWVTFTGSTALKVQVREPKISVEAKMPEKVTVGDPATIIFSITNAGDHKAEGVKLGITLPTGLEVKPGTPEGVDLGTLAAGETRDIKLTCIARKPGAHVCQANAEGAGGLKANASGSITVVQPLIGVEVAGPKLRYLERKAIYTVKVTNPGDAAAVGVSVTHEVPAGFKFSSAEANGKYDSVSKSIKWAVGDVAPGQTRELKCELIASSTGDFTHKVVASGERGLKAEGSAATRVDGLSAMAMEVTDTDDPVEVGSETSYEIRVANTGSKDETDVKVVCALPPQMKFKSARGPGSHEVSGAEVVFEVLKTLPARTEVTYRITVIAKEKGDARFKATLTAAGLTEPVSKQESTRVYAD